MIQPADTAAASAARPLPARRQRALELLKRPDVDYAWLTGLERVGPRARRPDEYPELTEQIDAQVEIEARYAGYVRRQQDEIERSRGTDELPLPDDLDYAAIHGLSHEIRQKLARQRPATVGQASRIPGVTPVAVSLLLVHLQKRRRRTGAAPAASAGVPDRAGCCCWWRWPPGSAAGPATSPSVPVPRTVAVGGAIGQELAADQILRKGNGAEPETLDPHRAEGVTASNVLRDLFEGLITEAPTAR